MKHQILKKIFSIFILFIILSQSLIPIILANQIEIENYINSNETTFSNVIQNNNIDNNVTNNILDNEFLNNTIDENVSNSEENIEDNETIENNIETNSVNEENILKDNIELEEDESDLPLNISTRSASSVATASDTTYFDSEYRLGF